MRGVTPSGGADAMNITRGTVTFWKKENFKPRQDTLEKVANYFGVPLSYLMGETVSPCPLCGCFTEDDRHETLHQRYLQAVERFGFCWNLALRRRTIRYARQALNPTIDGKEQLELCTALAKAHFSESLSASGYSPAHLPFPLFRALLLQDTQWESLLSPTVLQHQRAVYPLKKLPSEAVYTLPVSLFTPPNEMPFPKPSPAASERPSSRLPLRDRTARIDTVGFTGLIPVLGQIAAGSPLIAEEMVEEYIPTHLPHPEEYFALRVHGDSMSGAGIQDGDTVLVHKQDSAESGQIVACLVNGEEATLKRFTIGSDDTVVLLPENSKYRPIVLHAGDLESGKARILGVATEVNHPLV